MSALESQQMTGHSTGNRIVSQPNFEMVEEGACPEPFVRTLEDSINLARLKGSSNALRDLAALFRRPKSELCDSRQHWLEALEDSMTLQILGFFYLSYLPPARGICVYPGVCGSSPEPAAERKPEYDLLHHAETIMQWSSSRRVPVQGGPIHLPVSVLTRSLHPAQGQRKCLIMRRAHPVRARILSLILFSPVVPAHRCKARSSAAWGRTASRRSSSVDCGTGVVPCPRSCRPQQAVEENNIRGFVATTPPALSAKPPPQCAPHRISAHATCTENGVVDCTTLVREKTILTCGVHGAVSRVRDVPSRRRTMKPAKQAAANTEMWMKLPSAPRYSVPCVEARATSPPPPARALYVSSHPHPDLLRADAGLKRLLCSKRRSVLQGASRSGGTRTAWQAARVGWCRRCPAARGLGLDPYVAELFASPFRVAASSPARAAPACDPATHMIHPSRGRLPKGGGCRGCEVRVMSVMVHPKDAGETRRPITTRSCPSLFSRSLLRPSPPAPPFLTLLECVGVPRASSPHRPRTASRALEFVLGKSAAAASSSNSFAACIARGFAGVGEQQEHTRGAERSNNERSAPSPALGLRSRAEPARSPCGSLERRMRQQRQAGARCHSGYRVRVSGGMIRIRKRETHCLGLLPSQHIIRGRRAQRRSASSSSSLVDDEDGGGRSVTRQQCARKGEGRAGCGEAESIALRRFVQRATLARFETGLRQTHSNCGWRESMQKESGTAPDDHRVFVAAGGFRPPSHQNRDVVGCTLRNGVASAPQPDTRSGSESGWRMLAIRSVRSVDTDSELPNSILSSQRRGRMFGSQDASWVNSGTGSQLAVVEEIGNRERKHETGHVMY
ncbi:hypothetical protein C8R47DRAFT_1072204 [Mycena vitilis]|nr:hypothetical protein C8R47DRAFT_1072204 [Mycena vitilis]